MSINLTGELVPSSATFGVCDAKAVVGGDASYANAAAIGAINAALLVIGQTAYDQSTGITYQLSSLTPGGGFANGTWAPIAVPAGGSWSPGADAVATSNITLSGEQTLNGVTTSGSRALVVAQTTASQNGLYTTGAGAWTRTADANTAGSFVLGKEVAVLGGTLAGTIYVCNAVPATLGTNPVGFVANASGGTSFNAAAPPAIGNATPNAAFFNALTVSGLFQWATGTPPTFGEISVSFATDADHVATSAEYSNLGIVLTSAGTLTAQRNFIVPLPSSRSMTFFLVRHAATSIFPIQVIGPSGTGALVQPGTTALVWSDGTNYYSVSGGSSSGFAYNLITTNVGSAIARPSSGQYEAAVDTLKNNVAITVQAWASPTAGDKIRVRDSSWNLGNKAVTFSGGAVSVQAPGTQVFNIGGTTYALRNVGEVSVFTYTVVQAGSFWAGSSES